MVAKQKSTAALRVIAKMNGISIDFENAQNAARLLKPHFVRLKVYLPPYALNQVIMFGAKKSFTFGEFFYAKFLRHFYWTPDFCTKFEPREEFSVRRSSYHFKAQKFRNLRAFDFFQLSNKKYDNWDIQNSFFIYISWRCLKILIALIEYNQAL